MSCLMMGLLSISLFAQDKIELKNSQLEGSNAQGQFYWWKHQAKGGGEANYSIEYNDVNEGSKKALKAEIKSLGTKPWFVSSQFNQKFKAKSGDEVKVTFFGKKTTGSKSKIKLVFQSDIKGSFQGKDFIMTEEWKSYSHTFVVNEKSSNNQIKFWYMEVGATYLIDDVIIYKN